MNKVYLDIKGACDMKTMVSILVDNGYKVSVRRNTEADTAFVEAYRIEVEVKDD